MRVDGFPLRLEPLSEGDIAGVVALEKKINSAPWSEQAFRNELNHPHGYFVVARLDNKVVGYGGVWMVIDEAHITTVAVSDEFRRRGIGKEIVTYLLDEARKRGMTCSTLEVRAGNTAAITLYRNLGFESTATRKGYYPDNKEDALVMWLYDL